MTAKEYLKEISRLEHMIAIQTQERLTLREKLSYIPSFIGGVKVHRSKSNDPVFVNLLARIDEIDREMNQRIQDLINARYDIINLIMSIKNTTHIQLLYKRYVENKSYELIAVEMHLEYQTVRNYHKDALSSFESEYIKVHT